MGRNICFIGTDGSGKSTIVKEIAKRVDGRKVYFGWKPFLPSTKLISWIFRKKGYKIADDMNKKQKKFSFVQEIMLVYYYVEYLARYLSKIAFSSKPVVIDRYFYDMYAHYDYASRSVLFKYLMRIYPKPDYIFFLDVGVEDAKKRKPEMDIELLKMHRDKYIELSEILGIKRIDTRNSVLKTVVEIMRGLR